MNGKNVYISQRGMTSYNALSYPISMGPDLYFLFVLTEPQAYDTLPIRINNTETGKECGYAN